AAGPGGGAPPRPRQGRARGPPGAAGGATRAGPPPPVLGDAPASPASIPPLTLSVTVEPGTAVHVTPSDEVKAENVVPDRAARRYAGAVPVETPAGQVALTPDDARSCTTMPLDGVISTA